MLLCSGVVDCILLLKTEKLGWSRVRSCMQTALILEYQKSVGLHTRSHLLHTLARYP